MTARSIPVTTDTTLNVGDQLHIEWQGTWWPGEVLALHDDGTVRIRYSGWDESFDETVTRNRLMLGEPPPASTGVAPSPAAFASPPPGPVYHNSLDRLLLGAPVTSETSLRVGEEVHVEWNGSWWAGEVRAFNGDGSVRIHYSGWEDMWDENVPRARLQLPAGGDRMVTLHLDRGWSLSGKLLEITPDGYLLYRAEDHKICVVNKQSVAYLEVDNPSREYH